MTFERNSPDLDMRAGRESIRVCARHDAAATTPHIPAITGTSILNTSERARQAAAARDSSLTTSRRNMGMSSTNPILRPRVRSPLLKT